ncbi:MAG: hypothetical protein R8M45_02180, partial [Ghiorsea sp.]
SGNFMAGLNGITRDKATGVSKAAVGADVAADRRYAGTMVNAIAHGRGVQGMGIDGINSYARNSNANAASEAAYRSAQRGATMSAAGSAIGLGVYAYKKWKGQDSSDSSTGGMGGYSTTSGLSINKGQDPMLARFNASQGGT